MKTTRREPISALLEKARKKCKLSQFELAVKSGVPISTIQKILSGITANPSIETMDKLAAALGVTIDDLYGSKHEAGDN